MKYKKFPFLTLALALSSLDTVTAISPRARSVDGGQLNRRDDENFTIAFMNLTDVGGIGQCKLYYNKSVYAVALPEEHFDSGSHCNSNITITYGTTSLILTVFDLCVGCPKDTIAVTESVVNFLRWSSQPVNGYFYGKWDLTFNQINNLDSEQYSPTRIPSKSPHQ